MVPQWLIEKKRDGGLLSDAEIREWIHLYTLGKIPDYQMSALAMAIFFQGMSVEETASLTDAMMRSGDTLSFANWPRPTADKHSTGGIGDKISLMLAPLAASVGLAVPMISGRGLGITGGTLDKLESIPGYNTHLDVAQFQKIVRDIGCSIIGQTAELAPADKKLYALRDVTGTVPSIPLITASIMSKKLAEGADHLVFDVKFGRAAFMKTREEAQKLAESLLRVGRAMGRKTDALLSDMNQPLGRTAGNAVEVREAVETLQGKGPADTRTLTIELTARMAVLANLFPDLSAARPVLAKHLDDGSALDIFRQMVEAHGGDAHFIDDPSLLPQPACIHKVLADADGVVESVDAEQIGRLVLQLGGGRCQASDPIDPAAGIDHLVQAGEEIQRGMPLFRLLSASQQRIDALLPTASAAVKMR